MRKPILLVTLVVLVAAAAGLTACSGGSPSPTPSASPPASAGGEPVGPAAGTKMAPGLYDLDDGSVVAVGTVEHRDLEGGFWAVFGGTEAAGDAGKVVAVITNGDEFAQELRENEGLSFQVFGERVGDASLRMAGPEITANARRARGRRRAGGVAPGVRPRGHGRKRSPARARPGARGELALRGGRVSPRS